MVYYLLIENTAITIPMPKYHREASRLKIIIGLTILQFERTEY